MKKPNIKKLTTEDIITLVGKVTISFRVKPATKHNLQIAANKLNISFANLCESILEDKLNVIFKNIKDESSVEPSITPGIPLKEKKSETPTKATETTETPMREKYVFYAKHELSEFLEKYFEKKRYLKGLINPNYPFLKRNETKTLDNVFKLNPSCNKSFVITRVSYSRYEVLIK